MKQFLTLSSLLVLLLSPLRTESQIDAPQQHTRSLTIRVFARLTIETDSLPDGLVSQPYTQRILVAGRREGVGLVFSVSSGTLPPGLRLLHRSDLRDPHGTTRRDSR